MFSEEDRRQVGGSSRGRECELSSGGWGQRNFGEEVRDVFGVAARRGEEAEAGRCGGQRKAVVARAGARARDGAKEGQGKDGRLWPPC